MGGGGIGRDCDPPTAAIVHGSVGLDRDTALSEAGEGVWEGAIVPGWTTPRGPLGGYVMAIVLRAMALAVADPGRTPRSATMHFLRVPAEGPVTVRATVERGGRSLSTVSARLEQDGRLLGLALAAYSVPWPGPGFDEAPIPEVAAPDERQRIEGEFPRDRPPAFTERLSMQHRFGDPPFSGSESGETGGWLGLLEERPVDALTIAICADAWFPAPWPRLDVLHPAPTIDLTIHFRSPLPLPDSLLLGRFRNRVVRDGFFDEDGELWAPDGTLVAQSRQLGLLLEPRG
jgi:acyl-CoA thioesterase